jgi:hypothetical protein
MADELKDILSNLNKDIDQEKLLQYLNRDLSKDEQHELEKLMNDDPFANDAIEGLELVADKKNIPAYIDQLNAALKKQTEKKKARQQKRKFQQQPFIYIVIVTVLLLIVICYLVVRKLGF